MATTILAAQEQPGYTLPEAARLAIIAQSPYSKRCVRIEQQRMAFIRRFGNDGVTPSSSSLGGQA